LAGLNINGNPLTLGRKVCMNKPIYVMTLNQMGNVFSITAVLKYAQHSSVLTCSWKHCDGWHQNTFVNAVHTVINRHTF